MHHRRVVIALALTAAASLHASAFAQTAATPPSKPSPDAAAAPSAPEAPKRLALGDPAPKLNIAHWLKGSEVKGFEKGKIYVVEFWATWCVPCIKMFPHLSKLQAQYKDKGVTFIGVSIDQKSVDEVRPFVERQGDNMAYTVAYDNAMSTGQAYMAATGQNGIPAAYIVDGEGRLVWWGHPGQMDGVLEQVVSGTYDLKAAKEAASNQAKLNEVGQRFNAAMGEKRFDDAEKIVDEAEQYIPAKDKALLNFQRLAISLERKDKPQVIARAKALADDPSNFQAGRLVAIANSLMQFDAMETADHALTVDIARKAVDAASKETGKPNYSQTHIALASALDKAGKLDEARGVISTAIDGAPDDTHKDRLKAHLAKINAPAAPADTTPKPAAKP